MTFCLKMLRYKTSKAISCFGTRTLFARLATKGEERMRFFCVLDGNTGLEIISRLAPVKLSGQTYFCSDTTHIWPDKSPLRHISTKFPPSPCRMMFTYETSTFSKPLLYMEPRTHCRKSGMHGTATTFGKINITFVHASIASVLCLLYR